MRQLSVLQPRPAQASRFDLDALEVETPCAVPWDSMQGDNRVRYCGHCRQNVYNIEALPRAEAVRLMSVREGRPCIRFYRRRDGTVVTADCWARLRAARRRGLLAFGAMLVVVGAAQLVAMVVGLAGLKWNTSHREVSAGPPLPSGDAPWAVVLREGALRALVDREEKGDYLMGEKRETPSPAVREPKLILGRMSRK